MFNNKKLMGREQMLEYVEKVQDKLADLAEIEIQDRKIMKLVDSSLDALYELEMLIKGEFKEYEVRIFVNKLDPYRRQ